MTGIYDAYYLSGTVLGTVKIAINKKTSYVLVSFCHKQEVYTHVHTFIQ